MGLINYAIGTTSDEVYADFCSARGGNIVGTKQSFAPARTARAAWVLLKALITYVAAGLVRSCFPCLLPQPLRLLQGYCVTELAIRVVVGKRLTTETRSPRRCTEKKGSGFPGFKDDQDERKGTEPQRAQRRRKDRQEYVYRFAPFAFLLCDLCS